MDTIITTITDTITDTVTDTVADTDTIVENNDSYGIIISAVMVNYTLEAIKCTKNIKKVSPNISVTLHTSHPDIIDKSTTKLFDKIVKIDISLMKKSGYKTAAFAKICKIKAMSSFPYNRTLYLDCDTKVVKPIDEIFNIDTNTDIAICNSPWLDKNTIPYKLIKYQKPNAYNSGVILYRNNHKIQNMFTQWVELCEKDIARLQSSNIKFFDQPKLVKILSKKDNIINIKVLPNTIYNARHTMFRKLKKDKLWSKVKIFHSHQVM